MSKYWARIISQHADFNNWHCTIIVWCLSIRHQRWQIRFPKLHYKLLIEPDPRLKFECRVTMSVSCIMFVISHICNFMASIFISSPEPSGSQGELIVYPYSGVRCRLCRCRRHRCQQCLNIFSSETALPIKAKFYVEPPWEGGTKVCINGPGHMTKMAAMPIYGKNL